MVDNGKVREALIYFISERFLYLTIIDHVEWPFAITTFKEYLDCGIEFDTRTIFVSAIIEFR